jgi:hypothetical protein
VGELLCCSGPPSSASLLQDPQLVPLDELDGSDSEGDEDMLVDDVAAPGNTCAALSHVFKGTVRLCVKRPLETYIVCCGVNV